MPNHVHGIVWIVDSQVLGANNVGADGRPPLPTPSRKPRSLGSFVAGFKSSVTKRIRDELNVTGIWQRNYYDHVIRGKRELDAICKYIQMNPYNWAEDDKNTRMGK